MRYANLSDHVSNSINYGDYLQFIAIQHVYENMGIQEDDITHISARDIETYQGEKLLLPLNFISSIIIKNNKIALSKDIIPVFLGFSLSSVIDKFDPEYFFSIEENVAYFRKYSPIGCRDQYTYDIFLSLGIQAYLNGCLTATFPRRDNESDYVKTIFADAPMALREYVPKELFENCEFMTQQAYFSDDALKDTKSMFGFIRKHYEGYKSQAAMVITSRLHVAVPCTAMGIPVIFAKDYIDQRFSWIEKLFPLYSINNYNDIDWKPSVLNYEKMKQKIIKMAASRIKNAASAIDGQGDYCCYDYVVAEEITQFYLDRKKVPYYDSHTVTHKNTSRLTKFKEVLTRYDGGMRYALWGANSNLQYWIDHISSEYPSAVLDAVIDSYKTGEYNSHPIYKPEHLKKNKHFVIVTAVSAANFAIRYLEEIGYTSDEYLVVADQFMSDIE